MYGRGENGDIDRNSKRLCENAKQKNIPKQPEDAGFSEIDWRCDRGVPLPV
ncbi:hypothetical protein D515_04935 [Grimontia indica]|uniref:Uncharacterized protein n=1 Tax=Grimontia indica TaxID=1056512 RepID=R1IJT6_9GAMM|nr:hypothetical protein D515_04935 [Grimontia indica]